MHHQTSVSGATVRRLAPGLAAAALTLAALLVLAGCRGGAESSQGSGEPTGDRATPPAATPSPGATAEAERPTGFLGQHGIYATFAPADLDLYRALLPPQFEMPERPQVLVFVADYYDINIPLDELYPDRGLPAMVPYLEGAVLLGCKYDGRAGLHVITMPVDDDTANQAGRLMGFPKYVADEIALEQNDGGWVGRVVHEGRTVMQLQFTPAPGTTLREGGGGGGGVSLYQLLPPSQGPRVNRVTSVSSADSRSQSLAGTVTIEVNPDEEWAGLIPEGAVGAVFRETTGASSLISSTPE